MKGNSGPSAPQQIYLRRQPTLIGTAWLRKRDLKSLQPGAVAFRHVRRMQQSADMAAAIRQQSADRRWTQAEKISGALIYIKVQGQTAVATEKIAENVN